MDGSQKSQINQTTTSFFVEPVPVLRDYFISLFSLTAIFQVNQVSQYQNVSILEFYRYYRDNDDGGGGNNWSYKTCKAPVKMSPPPRFLQARYPSCRPSNSVVHWRDNHRNHYMCKILYLLMKTIEGLHERTEHLDIFLFFRPSHNGVLFPMFCLLVEGECQISVF